MQMHLVLSSLDLNSPLQYIRPGLLGVHFSVCVGGKVQSSALTQRHLSASAV